MTDKSIASTSGIQTHPSDSRSPQFWLKIFIVVQLTLLAVEFSPDLSTNGDDAHYYLLGKSLMCGNGYRDLYDPANPVQTQFPPVFPALLGLRSTIFPFRRCSLKSLSVF